MMRSGTKALLAALVLSLSIVASGCGGDDDDGGGTDAAAADANTADAGAGVPAAPSGLAAELLEGGAHLTWVDNSDDETQFMIMRKVEGAVADYALVASPPFDTTQYHDAPLDPGTTYMYMVIAMNDAGESEPSNEVTIAIP